MMMGREDCLRDQFTHLSAYKSKTYIEYNTQLQEVMEYTNGFIREMQIQLRTQNTEEPFFLIRDLGVSNQQREKKGRNPEAKTKTLRTLQDYKELQSHIKWGSYRMENLSFSTKQDSRCSRQAFTQPRNGLKKKEISLLLL